MCYCSKQYIRQLPEHFGAKRSPTWSASADPYWVLHPFLMASQRSRCITRYLPQAVRIKYNIQLEKNIHIARSWQFPLVNEFNITHFILTFRMETDISSTLHWGHALGGYKPGANIHFRGGQARASRRIFHSLPQTAVPIALARVWTRSTA